MNLLTFYKQRYGEAVKVQGAGFNGPCPLCGGEHGKSDRFIIWPERGENLGHTCDQHGIRGIWSCRQCGAGGDTVSYLMQIEGMDFKAALAELGIDGGRKVFKRRSAPKEPRQEKTVSTKQSSLPAKKWRDYAAKIVQEASTPIWEQAAALKWLVRRGIDGDAIVKYGIGYLPPEGKCTFGRFRHRAALDLAPKVSNGKEKRLFIPRGIVIPTFLADGSVSNIRIRRHSEDLSPLPDGRMPPKYMELEGSSTGPMLLKASGAPALAVYFITEAELDAILIHHMSGGKVGAVAVRTNRGKPDSLTHDLLKQCASICIALDYDDAGAQGVEFWEDTYPQARRWPTPEGKDPGDAFALGVNIREWIAAALPPCVSLPQTHTDCPSVSYSSAKAKASHGHMGTCSTGTVHEGGRGKQKTSLSSKEKTIKNSASVHEAPSLLKKNCWAKAGADTPLDVAELPKGAPSMQVLRSAFAGKEIHPELVVACPKHKWWWVYYDRACTKCSGHSLCIVDFQVSAQMRAPLTSNE